MQHQAGIPAEFGLFLKDADRVAGREETLADTGNGALWQGFGQQAAIDMFGPLARAVFLGGTGQAKRIRNNDDAISGRASCGAAREDVSPVEFALFLVGIELAREFFLQLCLVDLSAGKAA